MGHRIYVFIHPFTHLFVYFFLEFILIKFIMMKSVSLQWQPVLTAFQKCRYLCWLFVVFVMEAQKRTKKKQSPEFLDRALMDIFSFYSSSYFTQKRLDGILLLITQNYIIVTSWNWQLTSFFLILTISFFFFPKDSGDKFLSICCIYQM